jgi:glycine/D-amino acid oxidase-like deaminating enzyme
VHVAVVGGGVIGLLSAVECALAGHQVTVVEQDTLPSPVATSYDRHRILRALHTGDVASTESAVRAHHRWIELERILSSRFYDRVGALTVLPREQLPGALSALWNSGAQAKVLEGDELTRAYPHVSFGEPCAVLESSAGVLLADRVLAACVGWLRWQPRVELLPHRTVVRIDPVRAVAHLADGTELPADAVIVAAGPWSPRLVPGDHADGLRLYRQSMLYCEVPAGTERRWRATPAMPALGWAAGAWLVPPVAGSPLKLSAASACREARDIGDRVTSSHWRDHLTVLFGKVIPGFDEGWVSGSRDCYYLSHDATGGRATLSMGEKAVAFSACGGGSFKFAPLIARSLMSHLTEPPGTRDELRPPGALAAIPGRDLVPGRRTTSPKGICS